MLCDPISRQTLPSSPATGAAPPQQTLSHQLHPRHALQLPQAGSAARLSPIPAFRLTTNSLALLMGAVLYRVKTELPLHSRHQPTHGGGNESFCKALLGRVARVISTPSTGSSLTQSSPRCPRRFLSVGADEQPRETSHRCALAIKVNAKGHSPEQPSNPTRITPSSVAAAESPTRSEPRQPAL